MGFARHGQTLGGRFLRVGVPVHQRRHACSKSVSTGSRFGILKRFILMRMGCDLCHAAQMSSRDVWYCDGEPAAIAGEEGPDRTRFRRSSFLACLPDAVPA